VLTLRKDEIEKVSVYDRQEEHHRRGNLSQVLESFECEMMIGLKAAFSKPPEWRLNGYLGMGHPGVNAWQGKASPAWA